jgi:hypothetical protein
MTGFITADGSDYLMGLFGGVELVASSYFIALVTQPVGTAEAGIELSEPVYPEYARAEILSGPENWAVAYGALTNTVDVSFGVPSADAWVGITGWAVCDAATEGRVLYAGDTDPYDVAIGDQVVLPAGSITLSLELDSWPEAT